MAKKIDGYIKLQIPAGGATPAPPVGPALGQKSVNIMDFCKQFNARTQDQQGRDHHQSSGPGDRGDEDARPECGKHRGGNGDDLRYGQKHGDHSRRLVTWEGIVDGPVGTTGR